MPLCRDLGLGSSESELWRRDSLERPAFFKQCESEGTVNETIRKLNWVMDADGNEAIYINGKLEESRDTFYMSEIYDVITRGDAETSHGPVQIAYEECPTFDGDWPESFDQIKGVES